MYTARSNPNLFRLYINVHLRDNCRDGYLATAAVLTLTGYEDIIVITIIVVRYVFRSRATGHYGRDADARFAPIRRGRAVAMAPRSRKSDVLAQCP